MNRETNPQGGISLFAVLAVLGVGFGAMAGWMFWSSRTVKIALRDQILDAISWSGDEKVLDVGCGRGLMLIGAARRLKAGKATAVDNWTDSDTTAETAVANAKAEGVGDKVKIENSDLRRLPYQANSFDVVTSGLALHNLAEASDRAKALDEMLRVVKPGGQVVVWDIRVAAEALQHFQQAGAEIASQSGLSLLWGVPGKWFVARKK